MITPIGAGSPKVFGIGFSKTGTSTLGKCFDILGLTPVARPQDLDAALPGSLFTPTKPFARGRLEDLPATILSRMGIDILDHFDGRPLQFIGHREFARDV